MKTFTIEHEIPPLRAIYTTELTAQNEQDVIQKFYMEFAKHKIRKITVVKNKKAAKERATELEYLKWFRHNADFGPAESDVIDSMNERFMAETGKNLPEGWNIAQDGETIIDK